MRAVRFAVSLLCQLPAVLGACRPRADRPSPPNDLAESHSSAATRDGGVWAPDAAIFSAPIGAVRVGSLDVVAGLVAKQGIVRAIGRADGALQWTADALTDVAWAPDTEIRVLAAAGGVAVVWRGLRHGKPVRTMVLLGPRGEPRGEPIEVGPTLCGTADGLAWTDPRAAGPVRVHARRWSEPAVHDVALVPADREPSLVCGDRAA